MLSEAILDLFLYALGASTAHYTAIVTANPATHFGPGMWSFVSNINMNFAKPIGVSLLVIYFLIEVVAKQLEAGAQMSLQTMLRPLMGFVLGITLLMATPNLIADTWNLGNSIVRNFDNQEWSEVTETEDLEELSLTINSIVKDDFSKVEGDEVVVDDGFRMLGGVSKLVMGMTIGLMTMVGNMIALFIVYGRLFEIYIRMAVAPIAMADIFTKGSQSTGYRFIKEFLALVLQGMFIILIARLFNMAQGAAFGGGMASSGGMGPMLGIMAMFITEITLLGKAGSFAKSIVGVQ